MNEVSDTPRYSVIIPARDEERHLAGCVSALRRALDGRSSEIIVVANRCIDRTEALARDLGCTVVTDESKNLSAIRNRGAEAATGAVLVTIDADSTIAPHTFDAIERAVGRGADAGAVSILPERWSPGIITSALALLPIALVHGIGGGLFFCKRDVFREVGGFDERFVSAEDIDFAKRVRRHLRKRGRRFAVLYGSPVLTSCRKFDRFGDWYFLNPKRFFTLLRGRDENAANTVWYDIER